MSCNVTFIMGIEFLDEIRVMSLSQVILDCNVTFMGARSGQNYINYFY